MIFQQLNLVGRIGYVSTIRTLTRTWPESDRVIALSALEQFDIADFAAQRAVTLSGAASVIAVLRITCWMGAGVEPAGSDMRRAAAATKDRDDTMAELNSQSDPRLRIALVEDDETLAMLLSYNLLATDLAVDWYADGREAVSAICVDPPSLVILDWMLPQLSGIEILRLIRRHPATCDLPVLMLTARSEPSDRARAMALGVDVFLAKPFSVSDLISSIGPLLLRRRRSEPGGLAARKGSSS